MKGIKFQLSNYLRVPPEASGVQRFLSMSFAALIPADPVQNHTHLHPLLRWQGMGLQRDGHNQQYAKEEVSKVWGAMNLSPGRCFYGAVKEGNWK